MTWVNFRNITGKLAISIPAAISLMILASACLNFYPVPERKFLSDRDVRFAVVVAIFLLALPNLCRRTFGEGQLTRAVLSLIHALRQPHHAFAVAGLFLVIHAIASAIWSPIPLYVALRKSVFMFVPLAMIGWLAFCNPRPLGSTQSLAKILVVLGVLLSVVGLLMYFFGTDHATLQLGPLRLQQRYSVDGAIPRISSLTAHPNLLATWLLFSLLATCYLARAREFSWATALALGTVQLVGLVMTGSRAGIISTLAGVAVFGVGTVAGSPRAQSRSILMGVVMLLGSAVAVIFASVTSPWQNTGRLSLDMALRPSTWAAAWETFLDHWLLGVGYATFYDAIALPKGLPLIHAHNIYLHVLAELGVIGLGLLLVLIIAGAIAALGLRERKGPDERRYGMFVIALLLAFGIHELSDTVFFVPYHQSVAFTMLMAYFLAAALVLRTRPCSLTGLPDELTQHL